MVTQGRMWVCTLNNPDENMIESYLEKWHKEAGASYVTGQLEKGNENGTRHLQYYLHFPGNKRPAALKKHCGKSHFTIVKKDNGAPEYCNKEETRIDGPWTYGIKPARQDKKGDLARKNAELIAMGAEQAVLQGHERVQNYLSLKKNLDALAIATTEPYEAPDVRGTWIWGPPGTGKSYYAREMYSDIYLKPQNKWWDGYRGQKTVLIDDHDNATGIGHNLKIWADRYGCTGESKGGTIPLLHRDLVITSNYEIKDLYKEQGEEMIKAIERRFTIIHKTDPFKVLQKKDDQEKMGFE